MVLRLVRIHYISGSTVQSDTVIPLIGYTRNKREPERVLVDYTSNDRHSLWKQNVRAFTYEVRGPGRSIRGVLQQEAPRIMNRSDEA